MDPQAPAPQQPNQDSGVPSSDPFASPTPSAFPGSSSNESLGSPSFQPDSPSGQQSGTQASPQLSSQPAPQVFGAQPAAGPVADSSNPNPDVQNNLGMAGPAAGQPAVGQPSIGQPMPKKRSKLKLAMLAVVGLAVLGAGSAAAYFGVIVPNKPENILQAAVKNTAEQKNVTSKITFEGKDKDSPAYKANITTKTNQEKKTYGVEASVTITGFTFSGEARYIDKVGYVKLGDLSNITDLVGTYLVRGSGDAFAQEYGARIQSLAKNVSNQWYEIDSTLIKEAKLDCALEADLTLTDADYQLLSDAYSKNPFVTINSTSSDNINGKAATKFELTLDDKKAEALNETIEQTSLFKKLNQCFGEQASGSSNSGLDQDVSDTLKQVTADSKTAFTLWVDKKTKTISQLAAKTTPSEEKQGTEASATATFDYSPVTIDKPENTKPITSLLTEVMQLLPEQPVLGAKIERFLPESQN